MRGVMGHSRGAMIPGVLLALVVICLLPGKRFSRSLLVGLGHSTMARLSFAMSAICPWTNQEIVLGNRLRRLNKRFDQATTCLFVVQIEQVCGAYGEFNCIC
jgi:hypothetical protein